MLGSRLRAVIEIAATQLRHDRAQTVLAVLGVTIAVLSATLLASVGAGVVATGEQKFDKSGRDIWITGGPTRIQPGTLGGLEASIHDAHTLSANVSAMDGVRTAVPMLFQTVYAGGPGMEPEPTLAVGLPGVGNGGGAVALESGQGFSQRGQVHYAGGTYDGPRVREVVLDPRLRDRYDVAVGETVHVGGTVVDANESAYEVRGTSRTFSRFLGSPVVVLPLSEVQTMTGRAQSDAATLVTVDAAPGADVATLEAAIQQAYPAYDVRTNREQLQAVLAEQALVIASGVALVVVGVLAGLALTVNVLSLLVFQQSETLAALRAIGISDSSLLGVVTAQGVLVGTAGGLLGLALTPLAGRGLSWIALRIVGFEGLVQTPQSVYLLGAAIAVLIGTISALVAGWRVLQLDALDTLRG